MPVGGKGRNEMLIDNENVLKLLQCPKSGGKLKAINNKLIGEDHEEVIEYDIVKGYPVLIDFENSVLRKEDTLSLSSVIERHSYTGVSGIAKRLINLPKKATEENINHVIRLLPKGNGNPRILIVGGGTVGQGTEFFYENPQVDLVSFDIYASPFVQFLADAHHIPLPDKSFDAVIVQAVLEHVLVPEKVVSEIYRILKENGIVYAETPFLQHVHEGAYDFTRYTESGHRYLFRKFELIRSGVSAGAGTQLLWTLDNFFRGLFRSKRLGKVVKLFFFWLQYCDKLIPDSYNMDSASEIFFLGKKQAVEINDKEIIAHYKGAQ